MLNEKQTHLLRRFIDRFGYPDKTGYLWFCVIGGRLRRADFPPGTPLFYEVDLDTLYDMEYEGLLSVYDRRRGYDFDGPYGSSPGHAPGKPTDEVSIVFISDEATDWIDEQRS